MTAFIFQNPWTTSKKMLTMDESFLPMDVILTSLKSDNFIIPKEDEKHHRHAFQSLAFDVLSKYCGPHMRKTNSKGDSEQPLLIPQMGQLPAGQSTKLHCLPGYDKNEVEVKDLHEVVRNIINRELGYGVKDLENKVVPFAGVLYTVNLLRYIPNVYTCTNLEGTHSNSTERSSE